MRNIPSEENLYAETPLDELSSEAIALLASAPRAEVTDEEYARHYEFIRRVRKAEPSTHKQFTKRSIYNEARAAEQVTLMNGITREDSEIPCDRRVLFLGGMSGAGKSSIVRTHPELLEGEFAFMNPDRVKVAMINNAMAPEIEGLLPLETDELIRYEATVLDQRLVEEYAKLGKNIVIDRTMRSATMFLKLREMLESYGYRDLRGIFVDVDPQEGYRRARERHRAGLNSFLTTGQGFGERPVPGSVAVSSTPAEESKFRTVNAETFSTLVENDFFTATPRVFNGVTGDEIGVEGLQNS